MHYYTKARWCAANLAESPGDRVYTAVVVKQAAQLLADSELITSGNNTIQWSSGRTLLAFRLKKALQLSQLTAPKLNPSEKSPQIL